MDFPLLIIDWYRLNKRDLPWRETRDPYLIWISEIILQQTRVDQGIAYYLKFAKNYPSVFDLASASEQSVLNDWQGLGYYSRARNLHASAKYIVNELNGVFPGSFDEVKKLKGVGPYTAAAISSFSFGESVAVVDGNVYRVLSRFYNIDAAIDSSRGIKLFQELADSILPSKLSSEYNQAIMEFGALQCVPVNPKCDVCPLQDGCMSFSVGLVSERPIKEKKTKITKRYFHYLIFDDNYSVVLEKRTSKDIWLHLYQFPLIESEELVPEEDVLNSIFNVYNVYPVKISKERKHVLSHQHIHAKFYHFNSIPLSLLDSAVEKKTISEYPFPRLIDRYLSEI